MIARTTVKPAALARNMARAIGIAQFTVRCCEDAARMEVSPSNTSSKQVPLPTNAQADSKTCHVSESKFADNEMAQNSGYSRGKARNIERTIGPNDD
jgi:hypothetical protein